MLAVTALAIHSVHAGACLDWLCNGQLVCEQRIDVVVSAFLALPGPVGVVLCLCWLVVP